MKLEVFAACLAVLAFSAPAHATYVQGVIQDVTIDTGANYARVAVGTTAVGGRPQCHDRAYSTHYGFDISTAKGKAVLSMAMAALLAGKTVAVAGADACIIVGAVEIEELIAFTLHR